MKKIIFTVSILCLSSLVSAQLRFSVKDKDQQLINEDLDYRINRLKLYTTEKTDKPEKRDIYASEVFTIPQNNLQSGNAQDTFYELDVEKLHRKKCGNVLWNTMETNMYMRDNRISLGSATSDVPGYSIDINTGTFRIKNNEYSYMLYSGNRLTLNYGYANYSNLTQMIFNYDSSTPFYLHGSSGYNWLTIDNSCNIQIKNVSSTESPGNSPALKFRHVYGATLNKTVDASIYMSGNILYDGNPYTTLYFGSTWAECNILRAQKSLWLNPLTSAPSTNDYGSTGRGSLYYNSDNFHIYVATQTNGTAGDWRKIPYFDELIDADCRISTGTIQTQVDDIALSTGTNLPKTPNADIGYNGYQIVASTIGDANTRLKGIGNDITGVSATVDDAKYMQNPATATLNMGSYPIRVSTITTSGENIVISPYSPSGNYNYAISIGSNAYNNYDYGVGVGHNAMSNYNYGVGVGYYARSNYNNGVGVGYYAYNNYNYGVGVGYNARSNYDGGVGVGRNAYDNYNNGVGVGGYAYDNYNNGVGVGYYARSNYGYGVGVGRYAYDNYNNGVGVGHNANSNYNGGIGIGRYASGNHDWGIGIGSNTHSSPGASSFGNNITNTVAQRFSVGDYGIWTSSGLTVGQDIKTSGLTLASMTFTDNTIQTSTTNFLGATQKATDSDLLDGNDSLYFAVKSDVANSTNTLQTNINTIQTQVNNIALSTGTIQTQVDDIALSTGTIQTQVNGIALSTGTIQTQVDDIALSTGVIYNTMVTTGTAQTISGFKVFTGFTQLGSTAPKIKMITLSTMTANAEGGYTYVTTTVAYDKIIAPLSAVALVGSAVIPDGLFDVGYEFGVYGAGTDKIYVLNHPTNSENLFNKPVTITIFYKE